MISVLNTVMKFKMCMQGWTAWSEFGCARNVYDEGGWEWINTEIVLYHSQWEEYTLIDLYMKNKEMLIALFTERYKLYNIFACL